MRNRFSEKGERKKLMLFEKKKNWNKINKKKKTYNIQFRYTKENTTEKCKNKWNEDSEWDSLVWIKNLSIILTAIFSQVPRPISSNKNIVGREGWISCFWEFEVSNLSNAIKHKGSIWVNKCEFLVEIWFWIYLEGFF